MLSWLGPYLTLFSVAMLAALVLTPLARLIAWRVGSVDVPGGRRINRRPLPRMGGIAVFAALFVSFATEQLLGPAMGWPSPFGLGHLLPNLMTAARWHAIPPNYVGLGAGFCLIFATGLLDDLVSLSPRQKLVGQTLAAAVAVSGGIVIDLVVNPITNEGITLGWVAYPITCLYLIAYANIFNLIDGLDGLASGIAVIASVTMWIVSTMAGRTDAAALAIMLAGATLGFLRYNFNPASVILGDSGALLIGFVLGCISLLSTRRVAGLTSIIVPLVIAGIPIIDTFSAIVRRGRAHVSIGQADKGHIHHRLMDEGFNQRQTVLFIYAWTGMLCVGSLVMTQVEVFPRIFIFTVLVVASTLFALRLHLFQPVLLHHYNPDTGTDELVTPLDEAFKEEEARLGEKHDFR